MDAGKVESSLIVLPPIVLITSLAFGCAHP